MVTTADVMEALHRATGLPIVADDENHVTLQIFAFGSELAKVHTAHPI